MNDATQGSVEAASDKRSDLSEDELRKALADALAARVNRAKVEIDAILERDGLRLRGVIRPMRDDPFTPTLTADVVIVPR